MKNKSIYVFFSGIFIREVENNNIATATSNYLSNEPLPIHKKFMHQIISKISENLKPILRYNENSTKTCVNFILPLSGRYKVFKRFLKMYEESFANDQVTKLFVILYHNDDSPTDFDKSVRLVRNFNSKYNSITILRSNETFSRGRALQLGVDHLQNDDLMLFIDVDMIFTSDAIERVRKNTVLNTKIYFPIVYSLYNPKLLNLSLDNLEYSEFSQAMIDDNKGFWRQFGFGIVSLYKSDYINLGGFNLLISGWGYEDVTFYDNVIKSNLKIVRSVDPDFIHIYHSVQCDENLDKEQKIMCLGTRANTLGSLQQLQKIFLKYRNLFR